MIETAHMVVNPIIDGEKANPRGKSVLKNASFYSFQQLLEQTVSELTNVFEHFVLLAIQDVSLLKQFH